MYSNKKPTASTVGKQFWLNQPAVIKLWLFMFICVFGRKDNSIAERDWVVVADSEEEAWSLLSKRKYYDNRFGIISLNMIIVDKDMKPGMWIETPATDLYK